jgi:hypothetical protein
VSPRAEQVCRSYINRTSTEDDIFVTVCDFILKASSVCAGVPLGTLFPARIAQFELAEKRSLRLARLHGVVDGTPQDVD